MDEVKVEQLEGVRVLRLNRGVTNPINLGLVVSLGKVLEAMKEEGTNDAVVLTGNDKFFSIGFDLPELVRLDREGMLTFYQAMNRVSIELYTFPRPTVAAIGGHATAGGCILALCCDYRHISKGRKLMGLNEVKLGLPVPYPADRMLHQIIGTRYAREIMETGEFYAPEQALSMGLVDDVVGPEELLQHAIGRAKVLGAMTPHAFKRIKANRVGPVKGQILANLEKREITFLEMWFSDETQQLLHEAMKRF